MKRLSAISTIFILLGLLWVNQVQAQSLLPVVDYAIFGSPSSKGKSYIETYILIPGNSVQFVQKNNGKYQANVEVSLFFKSKTTIVQFDKYVLDSKEVATANAVDFNLIDLQRHTLQDGDYELELLFKDLNDTTRTATFNSAFAITTVRNKTVMSDIVLLESFKKAPFETMYTKNGYNLIPDVAQYYPDTRNSIAFYVETYHANKTLAQDAPYMLSYAICKKGTNKVVNNISKFKKVKASNIEVLMAEVDITNLPSGNYDLVLQAIRADKSLMVENRTTFQRNKKGAKPVEINEETDYNQVEITNTFVQELSKTELEFFLKATQPICTDKEVRYISNIARTKDHGFMARFLYHFWTQRNPDNPRMAFHNYRQRVIKADALYKTSIFEGYETERGRIFLRYGLPNEVLERPNQPGALPHEVWHYYDLQGQDNIKFIFYVPNLGDGEYKLLHSNAQGEIREPQWKSKIFNNRIPVLDWDIENIDDHHGSKVREIDGRY